jgi:hypothetical protein
MAFELKPKHVTTPLGAVMGLIITRKLLRENQRTITNQLIGTGIGAGAGYLGGEFLEADPINVDITGNPDQDRPAYSRYVRNLKTLTGDPSATEMELFTSAYPTERPEGGYLSESAFEKMQDNLHRARLFKARQVVQQNAAARAATAEEAETYRTAASENARRSAEERAKLPGKASLGLSYMYEQGIKKPGRAILDYL